MTDPANAVYHAIKAAVTAVPAVVFHAFNRSVKSEARALLKLGPCSRQSKLTACCKLWPDLTIDESLRRGIEAQRHLAITGHWTYDRNCLVALRGHRLARRVERRMT